MKCLDPFEFVLTIVEWVFGILVSIAVIQAIDSLEPIEAILAIVALVVFWMLCAVLAYDKYKISKTFLLSLSRKLGKEGIWQKSPTGKIPK